MSSYTKSYKEEAEKSNNIYRATITFDIEFDVEDWYGHNTLVENWLENHDRGSESAKFLFEALEEVAEDHGYSVGALLLDSGYDAHAISSVTLTKV